MDYGYHFVNANVQDIDEAVRWGRISIEAAERQYNDVYNQVLSTLNDCKYKYAEAKKEYEKVCAALNELVEQEKQLIEKIHDYDAWANSCHEREDYAGERDNRAKAAMLREDLLPLEEKIKEVNEIKQKVSEELSKQAVALEQAQSLFEYTEQDLQEAYRRLEELEATNRREAEQTKEKIISK